MNKQLKSVLKKIAPSAVEDAKDTTMKAFSIADADSKISKHPDADSTKMIDINERRDVINNLDEYLKSNSIKALFQAFYHAKEDQISIMQNILAFSHKQHLSLDECFFTFLYTQILEDRKVAQPLLDKFVNEVVLKEMNMATSRIYMFEKDGGQYLFQHFNLSKEDYSAILSDDKIMLHILDAVASSDLQDKLVRYAELDKKDVNFREEFLSGKYFKQVAELVAELDYDAAG